MTELKNSQINPILEAFYNTHTVTPLKLYDCLVPKIKDLQKTSKNETKKIAMSDGQPDLDEVNVRDFDDASDSDSVNYRRALAQQNTEIITLKG